MRTVGIDEVGRGCWAGPVVAAAVLLDDDIPGLTDSKAISKKRRDDLSKIIYECSVSVGIGWVDALEVDANGLSEAVRKAMSIAMSQIYEDYDKIIIDGNINFLAENDKSFAVIGADKTEPTVSAASIVAKVARDNYMCKMALNYPEYGFESHVGYGTAKHIDALKKYGITSLHRLSYKPVQKFSTGNLY